VILSCYRIVPITHTLSFSQEDAHIVNPNFEQGIGLFAIFDGHGGLEAAKFCEAFFEPKLKE
jgi:serine/threonine protein phosphatase PrpC